MNSSRSTHYITLSICSAEAVLLDSAILYCKFPRLRLKLRFCKQLLVRGIRRAFFYIFQRFCPQDWIWNLQFHYNNSMMRWTDFIFKIISTIPFIGWEFGFVLAAVSWLRLVPIDIPILHLHTFHCLRRNSSLQRCSIVLKYTLPYGAFCCTLWISQLFGVHSL